MEKKIEFSKVSSRPESIAKALKKCEYEIIQIYLLYLRIIVLEQLPRGNVNIIIVATVVHT